MRVPQGLFSFVRHHAPAPAPVASVTITPATLTVEVGSSAPLSATVVDTDGTVLTGRTLSWASDAPSVASIDSATGQVTGLAAGTANITATDVDSGVGSAAPAVVTVQAPPSGRTGKLLFVQSADDEGSMDAGEKTLVTALRNVGWTVDVGTIGGTGQFDLLLYRAAVLGPSCGYNSNWATSWKVAPLPYVCLSAPAVVPLGLATRSVSLGNIDTIERSVLKLPGVDDTVPGAFGLFTSTNKLGVNGWGVPSQDAQVWYHALGDHFTPVFAVYDRGEMLSDGGTAAARRAFGSFGFKADVSKWSLTGAKAIVLNATDWLVADPGDTVVPRYSYTRSYSPNATSLTATSLTTVPAGRTIASESWRLLGVDGVTVLATGSGGTYSPPPLADGPAHLDLTATDSLGNSRTKRQLIRAELVAPVAGFTYTREDGSPNDNYLDITSTTDDRGVPIVSETVRVYSDPGLTTLVLSTTSTHVGPLPNATYYVTLTAKNSDNAEDTTAPKTISVPTPATGFTPRGGTQPVEMHGVGEQLFAYCMLKPAPGTILTFCEWTVNFGAAGTLTFGGDTLTHPDALHPGAGVVDGKPVALAVGGVYGWSCLVRQSNGWEKTYAGVVTPEPDPEWAHREDYTRPADPPTNRDLYCDAAAASDGDGLTPSTPCKLLSTLQPKIRVGDRVNLAGDFTSQNYKLNLTNLGGGTVSLGTVIQQWAGQPQAVLYNDQGSVLSLTGAKYAAARGLHLKMQRIDSITGTYVKGDCIYASDGDHVYAFDCTLEGYNGFHPFRSHDFWLDGCTIIDSGTDVTTSGGNGGYSVKVELSNRGTVVRNNIGNAGHNALEAIQNTSPQGRMPGTSAEYGGQLILASDCRFAWNYVRNTWSGGYGPAGGERMLIEHNAFLDTGTALPLNGYGQVGSHGINFRQDLNTFRFNRVYREYAGCVQIQSQFNGGRHQARRNRSYHNTYYDNGNSGAVYADVYHINAGYLVDELGFFMEDNVFECECAADNHGRSNNAPKTYQIFLLIIDHEWTGQNVWGNLASGTNRLGPSCAGNIVRNSNFKPRDSELSSGGGQFLQISAQGLGSPISQTANTPADAEAIYPEWIGNTMDTPVFVSTADPEDWTNTTSLAPDPTSPTYATGVAVAGLDYSALGGRVPKGWDPAL